MSAINEKEYAILESLILSKNTSNILNAIENALKELEKSSFTALIVNLKKALLEKNDREAMLTLKKIEATSPDELLTICCRIIFYCYTYNQKNIQKYLNDAKNLAGKLAEPTNSVESSFRNYVQTLCQWVASANQNVQALEISPFWKNFTEAIFDYSQEYKEEQARNAEIERQRKAQEDAQKRELLKKQIQQQQLEDKRRQNIQLLKEKGFVLGSFTDERDGKKYNTITVNGIQTWFLKPLCYKEDSGLCSLGLGIEQSHEGYRYTWIAMKKQVPQIFLPFLANFIRSIPFILLFVIFLTPGLGYGWLLSNFYNFESFTDYIGYWGISALLAIILVIIAIHYFKTLLDDYIGWYLIIAMVALSTVEVLSAIYIDYYWGIWGTVSAILSLFFSLPIFDKHYHAKYGVKNIEGSIAPVGFKIPSKKDCAHTKKILNDRLDKYEILKIIKSLFGETFLTTSFWLDDCFAKNEEIYVNSFNSWNQSSYDHSENRLDIKSHETNYVFPVKNEILNKE